MMMACPQQLNQDNEARQTMDTYADFAIETQDLTKVFGKTRAVDAVNLTVQTGSVYGFLGPNGAGKTTMIRMLATLLRPDDGTARVFGHDVVHETDAVRRRVSLTGQFASVDEDLNGWENLMLLGRLLGYSRAQARARANELLDAFDLVEAAHRQVKKFSGGMRRKLDIAASLVVTPDLLFLDEPTTGLDPRSRKQVWELIRAIVANGTTVLLTTQYLDEADQLASRIAVIDHGKIIAEGTNGQLKSSVGSGAVHVRLFDPEQRPEAERVLSQALGVSVRLESDPAALSAQVAASPTAHETGERVALALAELSRSGIAVTDFALGQPSLDEVFLALTGHPAQDHVNIKEETL
jgi:ABC-2 type transport system ATP-binding protein